MVSDTKWIVDALKGETLDAAGKAELRARLACLRAEFEPSSEARIEALACTLDAFYFAAARELRVAGERLWEALLADREDERC